MNHTLQVIVTTPLYLLGAALLGNAIHRRHHPRPTTKKEPKP